MGRSQECHPHPEAEDPEALKDPHSGVFIQHPSSFPAQNPGAFGCSPGLLFPTSVVLICQHDAFFPPVPLIHQCLFAKTTEEMTSTLEFLQFRGTSRRRNCRESRRIRSRYKTEMKVLEYLLHSTLSSNSSVSKQYYRITPTQVDSTSSHSRFQVIWEKKNKLCRIKSKS